MIFCLIWVKVRCCLGFEWKVVFLWVIRFTIWSYLGMCIPSFPSSSHLISQLLPSSGQVCAEFSPPAAPRSPGILGILELGPAGWECPCRSCSGMGTPCLGVTAGKEHSQGNGTQPGAQPCATGGWCIPKMLSGLLEHSEGLLEACASRGKLLRMCEE